MKTKQAIIRRFREYGLKEFYVYQYHTGHWGACSLDSPNGIAIKENGCLESGFSLAKIELVK